MGCSGCSAGLAHNNQGRTINTAIIVGQPNSEVVKAKVVQEYQGLIVGWEKYFRGTKVQHLVDEGVLVITAGGSHSPLPSTVKDIYYVGGIGYHRLSDAREARRRTGMRIEVRRVS